MTFEQNTEDLAHHEHEIAAHDTFNYAALDSEGPRCSVASKRPARRQPWQYGAPSLRSARCFADRPARTAAGRAIGERVYRQIG
jgi:hypothetical protein